MAYQKQRRECFHWKHYVKLAGTFTILIGTKSENQAVLILPGSGNSVRDGIDGNKPFFLNM
jgi:hypothetical protein